MGLCELCGEVVSERDAYGVGESGQMYCIGCLSQIPIHVIPIDDIEEHKYDANCKCNPYQEEGIWIHSAFDCRELLDMDGIIMN